MGGTLRYWREIACVVIVCTIDDEKLQDYNPITYASRVFDPNGLVDGNGRVRNVDIDRCSPQFTTQNYKLKCCFYETLNFAFYLDKDMMTLHETTVIEPVEHTCFLQNCPDKNDDEEEDD